MDDGASLLDREVAVLAGRLRHWTRQRWSASAPPYENRARAAFHLARRFAELADAPTALPWIAAYAVPDQIAVTGHDLAVSNPSDETIEVALEELRTVRDLLGI